jgi:hypothetical protein
VSINHLEHKDNAGIFEPQLSIKEPQVYEGLRSFLNEFTPGPRHIGLSIKILWLGIHHKNPGRQIRPKYTVLLRPIAAAFHRTWLTCLN